jgi:hypothetical protein
MLPLYYQQNHRLFIRNLLWLILGALVFSVALYFVVFRVLEKDRQD